MQKIISYVLAISLLAAQNANAYSLPSLSTKKLVGITSAILAVPCFKKCYDFQVEHDLLIKSVVPNFEEIFKTEYKKLKCVNDRTVGILWDKLIQTHVAPNHPEIISQLDRIGYKTIACFILGGVFITAAILCAFSKKKAMSSPAIS